MKHQQIVVYETKDKDIMPKMIVGTVGLIGTGSVAFLAYNQPPSLEVFLALACATIAFGVASLLTWRKKGEYEIVEIKDGMVYLISSQSKTPTYSAPMHITKFQRLRLPNGTIQLYMRDGEKAVEVAKTLPPKQRDILAEKIEEAMAKAV